MGKLSSIEDVEAREAAARAERAPEPVRETQPASDAPASTPTPAPVPAAAAHEKPAAKRSAQPPRLETAADEEDFHGLSSGESLGAGHGALVAIAVVAVIVVAVYFVNYWFHIL